MQTRRKRCQPQGASTPGMNLSLEAASGQSGYPLNRWSLSPAGETLLRPPLHPRTLWGMKGRTLWGKQRIWCVAELLRPTVLVRTLWGKTNQNLRTLWGTWITDLVEVLQPHRRQLPGWTAFSGFSHPDQPNWGADGHFGGLRAKTYGHFGELADHCADTLGGNEPKPTDTLGGNELKPTDTLGDYIF